MRSLAKMGAREESCCCKMILFQSPILFSFRGSCLVEMWRSELLEAPTSVASLLGLLPSALPKMYVFLFFFRRPFVFVFSTQKFQSL